MVGGGVGGGATFLRLVGLGVVRVGSGGVTLVVAAELASRRLEVVRVTDDMALTALVGLVGETSISSISALERRGRSSPGMIQ